MKRLIITLSAIGCLLYADPNPVGNWKLTGLKVDYLHIARETTEIALNDVYGSGVRVVVATVPAGAVYARFTNGPFTNTTIEAANLNLNVNLYPDYTGAVAEGSFYPDIDLIPGTCITSPQIFPVTDQFIWEIGSEGTFAPTNIIGIPGLNESAGSQAWGFGIAESGTFDGFPSTANPERVPPGMPYIALTDGTVLGYACDTAIMGQACGGLGYDLASNPGDLTACVGDLAAAGQYVGDGSGAIEQQIGQCFAADQATAVEYFGGAGWLSGSGSSGYFALDQGNSQMGQDLNVDFLLEWNAIDGVNSGSGIDSDDDDDDGNNTEFDRIFGYPYLEATNIDNTNPLCDITGGALAGGTGLNYPVAGDVVAELGGEAGVSALVTGKCLAGTADGVYDGCLDSVASTVEAQCDAAGSPVDAVSGLCFGASQTDDFAAACAGYGAGQALVITCQQLGFDDETCNAAGQQGLGGVEAYCVYMTGFDCATAGIDQCSVLTDPTFAGGLCGTLAASLTTSETCDVWASSFDEAWLDANAAQSESTGYQTCSDLSAGLAAGLGAGDATAIATLDALFAAQAGGMTCTAYGSSYVSMCVTGVSNANDMYLMDPALETWGLVLTYNAASVQQYMGAGYTLEQVAGNFPELFINDSGWDFDPTCYATGETCSGRLVMHFDPTCIPEIEARQIVAEFVDLDDLCEPTGDVTGGYYTCFDNGNCGDGTYDCFDGNWDNDGNGVCTLGDEGGSPYGTAIYTPDGLNVVDIVRIVDHILGGDQLGGTFGCQADMNGDGIINVVDVVAIVQAILGRTIVENDATTATLSFDNNQISIEANGHISGVELVVEFTGNLDIDFADNYIADYSVDGNTAHILLIGTDNVKEVLTVNSGTITSIVEAIVVNSSQALETSSITIEEPATYVVGKAFPNPFNPSTNISLELTASADISVKVYNLMGQLVSVIAEGSYSPSTYNWTWNADNLASGAYLVKTQVGSDVNTQKVMLLK